MRAASLIIAATLKDSRRQVVGQAVGQGDTELEAINAVLRSSERFATETQSRYLAERVTEAMCNADEDCLKINIFDIDWDITVLW